MCSALDSTFVVTQHVTASVLHIFYITLNHFRFWYLPNLCLMHYYMWYFLPHSYNCGAFSPPGCFYTCTFNMKKLATVYFLTDSNDCTFHLTEYLYCIFFNISVCGVRGYFRYHLYQITFCITIHPDSIYFLLLNAIM